MSSVSVNGKNWISKEFDSENIDFLKTNYFLDEVVAKLLSIRKINKNNVKSFLNPSIKSSLPNPFILKDMDKAIDRTLTSITQKEKIGIFGDYDVDGATSTAILGKYFRLLKIKFEKFLSYVFPNFIVSIKKYLFLNSLKDSLFYSNFLKKGNDLSFFPIINKLVFMQNFDNINTA